RGGAVCHFLGSDQPDPAEPARAPPGRPFHLPQAKLVHRLAASRRSAAATQDCALATPGPRHLAGAAAEHGISVWAVSPHRAHPHRRRNHRAPPAGPLASRPLAAFVASPAAARSCYAAAAAPPPGRADRLLRTP